MTREQLRANLAVLEILRRSAAEAGDRIEVARLCREWPRYGMRERDCRRAIDHLLSISFFEPDRTRGTHQVVLTERGARAAYSFVAIVESLRGWPRRIARTLRPWATGGSDAAASRRRISDRAEAGPHSRL